MPELWGPCKPEAQTALGTPKEPRLLGPRAHTLPHKARPTLGPHVGPTVRHRQRVDDKQLETSPAAWSAGTGVAAPCCWINGSCFVCRAHCHPQTRPVLQVGL